MALFSNATSVIRQYISSAVGDLIMGTPDSGDATSIVDTELADPRWPDDHFNQAGYRAYIWSGTNIGEERFVTDWVQTSHDLTLAPDFSSAIDATSKYELHYIFFAGEYLKAINLGIEAIAGKYLIEIKDETTITLVADTYEYALPTSMLYLYRVITEDEADSDDYFNADIIDPRFWSIIKSYPPTLKLDKRYYSVTADLDLRLEGQGTQPLVDSDDDVIYLPPKWLVAEAILNLPRNKIQSNKLDGVYAQAEKDAWLYRRTAGNWPNPRARKIVE